MKRARWSTDGVEIVDDDVGPLADGWVRLQVTGCGICGSDLRYVRLGGLAGPTPRPMPLGHELSGVVEALGEEVHASILELEVDG